MEYSSKYQVDISDAGETNHLQHIANEYPFSLGSLEMYERNFYFKGHLLTLLPALPSIFVNLQVMHVVLHQGSKQETGTAKLKFYRR